MFKIGVWETFVKTKRKVAGTDAAQRPTTVLKPTKRYGHRPHKVTLHLPPPQKKIFIGGQKQENSVLLICRPRWKHMSL